LIVALTKKNGIAKEAKKEANKWINLLNLEYLDSSNPIDVNTILNSNRTHIPGIIKIEGPQKRISGLMIGIPKITEAKMVIGNRIPTIIKNIGEKK
jgi:hypothetical protein